VTSRLVPALLLVAGVLVSASDVPDKVRISTIVTDRQGRPVNGLTSRDFELKEDGVIQKLISVEAKRPEPRRIAILLDEFHVAQADSQRVRDALLTFAAEQLRAEDTTVVLKPLDPLTRIQFSQDRKALRDAIESFDGRKDRLEPRNALEEETIGRSPELVRTGRAQVVLSGLRALATQLGSAPGRSAILLVSEGFIPPQPRRMNVRGLPDVGIVERFANRYDVPIYAFDPRPATAEAEADPAANVLNRLVTETGGTFARGENLAPNLARASTEIDSGYTLTYEPSRSDDGRYHPVSITVVKRAADARSRGGYVAPPSEEARRAMREILSPGPILPTRMLRRSPLVDIWSGVTRVSASEGRVVVTWEPVRAASAAKTAGAARVELKATTKDGKVLFEGLLAPVRIGELPDASSPDRAEFMAPTGRVQLDMNILGNGGQKIDVDGRDIEVPSTAGKNALLLPAMLIATQSAREFREVSGNMDAPPDPSRSFRRTERLVIRVPAYAAGAPASVTAKLLNRLAQPMRDLEPTPVSNGVTQFDLSLAPLAPGEYFLQFSVAGPAGPVDQRIAFRITG
jgi:VWFA-related protein